MHTLETKKAKKRREHLFLHLKMLEFKENGGEIEKLKAQPSPERNEIFIKLGPLNSLKENSEFHALLDTNRFIDEMMAR